MFVVYFPFFSRIPLNTNMQVGVTGTPQPLQVQQDSPQRGTTLSAPPKHELK